MPPTAPTVASGSRNTLTGISSARRRVEMLDQIYQYDADAAPTLAILSKRAAQMVAGSPTFKHLEDQPLPDKTTTSTSMNSTTTTLPVATGTGRYFRAGDVVLAPTAASVAAPGEIMLVSSITNDNVTVVRAYTGDQTTGGAIGSGDHVQIIGNTNAEFATARTEKTTTEATVTNYTQIIRTPFSLSKTLDASNLYGPPEHSYQRQKAAVQHTLECERAVLFGKPYEDTTNIQRTTGGFLYWVTSNKVSANGTLTWPTVESLFSKVFRYGSRNKLMMMSRTVATALDMIAEGRIVTSVGQNSYGVNVGSLQTTHGSISTVIHDQLTNDWDGYALVVDLDNIKLRYMRDSEGNRFNVLNQNIQANDADGIRDEYLSEIGLQIMLESAHGVLYGVT